MFWAILALCLVLLAFSINAGSLWIDEGFIAWVVRHDSFHAIAVALSGSAAPSPADRQYPLYDLWMWCWTRIFGSTEYALRAANLPFAALYLAAIAATSRLAFKRKYAWLPFAFAPFIWFYLNEARPYMMLAAFATCLVGAVAVFSFGSPAARARAIPVILPALFCTWATHILAVLMVPGLILLLYCARCGFEREDRRRWLRSLLVWALPILAVTAFYLTTLIGSSKAEVSNNQNRGSSPAAFSAEIMYEQLGFAGLGPGRNSLRAAAGRKEFGRYLPWLGLGIAGWGFFVLSGLRGGARRPTVVLLAAWLMTFIFAVIASEAMHARFLARHLAATFPFFLFAAMSFLRARIAGAVLVGVFLLSDLRLSALPAYAKDDYRNAVAGIVLLDRQHPGTIDWAADDITANYYGLGFESGQRNAGAIAVPWKTSTQAILVTDLRAAAAQSLIRLQLSTKKPVYLVLSKPDVFDEYGGLADAVKRLSGVSVARYEAFEIFRFEPAGRSSRITDEPR